MLIPVPIVTPYLCGASAEGKGGSMQVAVQYAVASAYSNLPPPPSGAIPCPVQLRWVVVKVRRRS